MADLVFAIGGAAGTAAPAASCKVGIIPRLSAAVFGSPDAIKAHGGYRPSRRRRNAAPMISMPAQLPMQPVPVYQLEDRRLSAKGGLPRIWLSEKACAASSGSIQPRKLSGCYPSDTDKGGVRALALAERYFAEGLNLVGEQSKTERVQCFQAAELLYMHAMHRGNLPACTRLGVLYRFDMCRGSYLKDRLFKKGKHAKAISAEATAFRLFRKAASQGDAEAMVQLGEMLIAGVGCSRNPDLAFKFFKSAIRRCSGMSFGQVEGSVFSEDGRHKMHRVLASYPEDAANMGNAALHIAEAFEQGRGARQSFSMARIWYEVAYEALSLSFDHGFWYSKRNKCKARQGYLRALQEINGKY